MSSFKVIRNACRAAPLPPLGCPPHRNTRSDADAAITNQPESEIAGAERHLLATLIAQPALIETLPAVSGSDFSVAAYGEIFDAISGLVSGEMSGIDTVITAATLEADGGSKTAIRAVHVLGSVESRPHAVRGYADIILRASWKREIVAKASELALNPDSTDVADKLDRAREKSVGLKKILNSAEAFAALLAQTDRRAAGEDPPTSTGLQDLDKMLGGGLRSGKVIVLAARPGEGKSALALGIAEAASAVGKATLFISLEMDAEEITERRVACMTQGIVDRHAFSSGILSEEQRKEMRRIAPLIEASRMHFVAVPSMDIDSITSTVRDFYRAASSNALGGLRLVVMDYLQLIETTGTGENREQQVAKVSRRIKQLALKLKTPVLLLSQMSRDIEKSVNKRKPRLSDLRESGAIEQDADIVLFIDDAEPDVKRPVKPKCIIVAKQRGGETGEVPVNYWGAQFRFASAANSYSRPVLSASSSASPAASKSPGPLSEVLQMAAYARGETEGVSPEIIHRMNDAKNASAAAAAASPFSKFKARTRA